MERFSPTPVNRNQSHDWLSGFSIPEYGSAEVRLAEAEVAHEKRKEKKR